MRPKAFCFSLCELISTVLSARCLRLFCSESRVCWTSCGRGRGGCPLTIFWQIGFVYADHGNSPAVFLSYQYMRGGRENILWNVRCFVGCRHTVLCLCLHDARVQRANKTWYLLVKSDNARRRALCHFLARPKKWRKKGAKGPNALWIPAMRKGRSAVALLIFSQKDRFQRLRLQVKETCKHEGGTQDAIAKALAAVLRGL